MGELCADLTNQWLDGRHGGVGGQSVQQHQVQFRLPLSDVTAEVRSDETGSSGDEHGAGPDGVTRHVLMICRDSAASAPPATPLAVPQPLTDLLGLLRSEEHTSELQSRGHLVCRLLLEKKNRTRNPRTAGRR